MPEYSSVEDRIERDRIFREERDRIVRDAEERARTIVGGRISSNEEPIRYTSTAQVNIGSSGRTTMRIPRSPQPRQYSGLFLETIGIEYESVSLSLDAMSRLLKQCGAGPETSVTRDASVEAKTTLSGNGLFRLNGYSVMAPYVYAGKRDISGSEIVTYPLPMDVMEETIGRITKALNQDPREFTSPRASIHIHVGFAKSLSLLKKSLLVGLAIDPLLFSIAGMGYAYRGEINESVYARPLEGGVAVATGGGYSHLLPILSLKAETISDFFLNYFCFGRVQRYHPARYFATNLYSVLMHGTIEFRHFNQTHNARWIMAAVHLVQSIAKLMTVISDADAISLRTVSVFNMDKRSIKELLFSYLSTIRKYRIQLDSYYIEAIEELLSETPIPVFSKDPPLTHSTAGFGPEPWMVRLDKAPRQSNYLDIHNLRSISIADKRY